MAPSALSLERESKGYVTFVVDIVSICLIELAELILILGVSSLCIMWQFVKAQLANVFSML